MESATLIQALGLARDGDVRGAIRCLQAAESLNLEGLSLLYMLHQSAGESQGALDCADRALELVEDGLPRSTWTLRRGLCAISLGQRTDGLAAMQAVLKMSASDDHVRQAHLGLLSLTDIH